ncbi:MAG: helix-turn-helix domain-containing protein [Trichloromonadaceae bacterium]
MPIHTKPETIIAIRAKMSTLVRFFLIPMNTLRNTLKAIRQTLGLTQDQFGEILGISGQQVSAIETGRCEPSKTLLKLAVHELRADPESLGLGDSPAEKSLEGRARKAFSHLVLAACVTAPVTPILAGSVAAGVGVATVIMRMLDAYHAKTESELAKKLEIQRGVLWRWKKGGSVPNKYLIKASQDTGKTVEWFLTGGGEKYQLQLLADTVTALEEEILSAGIKLDICDKGKAVSYLFNEFINEGFVDREKIKNTLKLLF